ncbi:MAG: hypothetical protein IID32_03990, partial [Planctomycetes bacterium]|nr:hypothetical protein [Planctomycetota bacterium]
MKAIKYGLIWMGAVALFSLVGCAEPQLLREETKATPETTKAPSEMTIVTPEEPNVPLEKPVSLRCKYRVGEVERVRFYREFQYRSWLEMPGKEPTKSGMRTIVEELIVRRKVESVEPDGSAVIKVTFEKAMMTIDTQKTPNLYRYISDINNTTTSQSPGPKLAGVSYRIRIAPDTSVLEIIGLDEQRRKLKLTDPATGVVSNWLSENSIRRLHERDFVKRCPDKATYNQTCMSLVSIPDGMIKAKAIRNTYTIGAGAVKNDTGQWVTVTNQGEPAYKVPDDFPPPPKPSHVGAVRIVSASEMEELKVEGTGTFDLTAAAVRGDHT